MQDLYLYKSSYSTTRIGHIEKINDKTIRMSDGTKILKTEFSQLAYKLNAEEEAQYRMEYIKKLSGVDIRTKSLLNNLNTIMYTLNASPFVEVNSDKLQKVVDDLTNYIKSVLPAPMTIKEKDYVFHSYASSLVEVDNERN